jgi:hypothetical protein
LEFDPKFFQKMGTPEAGLRRFHPIAERFPLMGNKQFEMLVENIKENGLQNPIVLYEDQILDGRNRDLACIKANVEPKFVEFEGKDPVAFAYAVNVHRRHLTNAQKAGLAEQLLAESPDRSNRAIGQLVQLHHKTVGRLRDALEARGAVRHVDAKVDTRGRVYRADRPRKASSRDFDPAEGSEGEAASWVYACAGGLRCGDIKRSINELLDVLDAEKKRIVALPEASRTVLARRFFQLVDVPLDELRRVAAVPFFEGRILPWRPTES